MCAARPVAEPLRIVPSGGEGPAIVNGQRNEPGAAIERRNGFEATLSSLRSLRFLTARMGLDPSRPVSARLRGDGATTVRFDGRWPGLSATLDGEPVAVSRPEDGGIALSVTLVSGRSHSLTITPTP